MLVILYSTVGYRDRYLSRYLAVTDIHDSDDYCYHNYTANSGMKFRNIDKKNCRNRDIFHVGNHLQRYGDIYSDIWPSQIFMNVMIIVTIITLPTQVWNLEILI